MIMIGVSNQFTKIVASVAEKDVPISVLMFGTIDVILFQYKLSQQDV